MVVGDRTWNKIANPPKCWLAKFSKSCIMITGFNCFKLKKLLFQIAGEATTMLANLVKSVIRD